MQYFFYLIISKIILLSYLFSNSKVKNKWVILFKYLAYEIINPSYINFGWLKFTSFDKWALKFLFWEIFVRNEYFFETTSIKPTIIDLWANTWAWIMYFKYLYPNSIIYAFEPDELAYNILQNNVNNNNLTDVYAYNEWISDKTWEVKFYTNSSEKNWNFTMSINKNRELNWKEVIIKTKSLYEFIIENKIEKIDMLKIDIEWAEDILFKMQEINNVMTITDKLVMEYHHNIPETKSNLDLILNVLKNNNFTYQIDTICFPLQSYNKYQDIYIYAYKIIK